MYRKRIIFAILISILSLFLIITNYSQKADSNEKTMIGITGKITNQADAEAALNLIEKNLSYATENNLEGYLTTIVASGYLETKKEIAPFFKNYQLFHQLLSFEIMNQQEQRMRIQTQQKTLNKDKSDYRSHIAEANYTLVKEDGVWKIQETIMTDTKFID
ncbi:hypothetical protein ACWOFR_05490 [Carnobacterium gallinarum]|uniref:hypothetical protein n=1 Tax=Carnobacterium gallinarum TaxID=2749 RepID=UPI0005530CEB|nr:hypothetical protein [Carnobacterium gallinarum]